ncbi:hypothetical protein [Actinocrinis sp.]|uniref:MerR family transcriptional regulator n=1 Tax=Actinocrinis sp. TaxID=1920516 RepID=UPI002D74BDAD|nr:hypothetical protein [Actinocrinis sp.]HZP52256.1 hypothetical protein [Actinocrinis sp.]
MAGTRGSTNGSGAGTRTARSAAEGRAGTGARAHTAASSYGRVSRRTLTIGEAAAALSADFPGVTAAALRRIEAAGQFIPARSSSGYRRYSEADLDLIRIVLSNQPAAAVSDPADAGHPDPGAAGSDWAGSPDAADLSGAEHPLTHPAAGQSAAEDEFAAVGAPGQAAAAARHTGRGMARTGRSASSRVPAARSAAVDDMQGVATRRQAGRLPADALFDVPAASGGKPVAGVPQQGPAGLEHQSQCADLTDATATVPGAAPASARIDSAAKASAAAAPSQTAPSPNGRALNGTIAKGSAVHGSAATSTIANGAATSTVANGAATNGPVANGSGTNAAATSTVASRRADRRWPDPEFFAPDLGEVALDRDQLAAAARTDRAWVDGLVEYGLLSGNRSAGGADLLVARAAAELAQFGMEPRHLRVVAASAARVAELITSATSPGPSRDAARRERTLLAGPGRGAEAAAAAVRLHAALVRAALLRG